MLAPNWLLEALRRDADGIHAYLFGSWLRTFKARDIDVLLVYPNGQLDRAASLAASLRGLSPIPVCDVIVLSEQEEDELSFVRDVSAVHIWPPSQYSSRR